MKVSNLPVISVVGPTAAGKTSFALKLARSILDETDAIGVDLISADSRQVYQGLEILSGADVPAGFVKVGDYYQLDNLKLWGVNNIKLTDEWSVAHFQDLAQTVIGQSEKNNRAVIIVGGTGLYHDRLFETDSKLHVPPNADWRTEADQLTVEQLQQRLKQLNPDKFERMNHSDQHNPRRLIRAVEIELAPSDHNQQSSDTTNNATSIDSKKHLYLGVKVSLDKIQANISLRVEERFEGGALNEVKAIINDKQLSQDHPARSILGFNEIVKFLDQQISAEDCQQLWSLHEFQYAKRQLTWWRKKSVRWVDSEMISNPKVGALIS